MGRRRVNLVASLVFFAGWGFTAVVPAAAEEAAPDSLVLCDRAYLGGDPELSADVARGMLAREPRNAAAAWRLSRALIAAGNTTRDTDRRHELLVESRAWAETAVAVDTASSEGFTCLAICQGNLSSLAGGRERIALAESARRAAERALALDADNDLAWLVLGVWNREVATVSGMQKFLARIFYGGVPPGASLARAEECLRRAVALAPEHINHHRELGITLMALKRYGEAVAEFERAVALPPAKPGDAAYQADAQEWLDKARDRRDAPPDLGLH